MTDFDAPKIRLCKLRKWPDFGGYGFNLHAEKGKAGQFIGKVDVDSPASLGGLKENDRVIEVNGNSVVSENHAQVVQRIKENSDHVDLLVVDRQAESYYTDKGITIEAYLSTVDVYECPGSRHEPPVIHYSPSNGHEAPPQSEVEEHHEEAVVGHHLEEDEVAAAAADAEVVEIESPAPPPPETLPPMEDPEPEVEQEVPTEHPEPALPEPATVEPEVQAAVAPAPVAAEVSVNHHTPVEQAPEVHQPANRDNVDFGKISAAEMRARIAGNKRNAAKHTSQSFREKYDVFQSL